MPNYDYLCDSCGKTFEVFQSMKDAKLTACTAPGCTGNLTRLLGTGAGVIFKGSGFYQTDYRSENYKNGAKKDSTASTATSSPAEKPTPAPKAAVD